MMSTSCVCTARSLFCIGYRGIVLYIIQQVHLVSTHVCLLFGKSSNKPALPSQTAPLPCDFDNGDLCYLSCTFPHAALTAMFKVFRHNNHTQNSTYIKTSCTYQGFCAYLCLLEFPSASECRLIRFKVVHKFWFVSEHYKGTQTISDVCKHQHRSRLIFR